MKIFVFTLQAALAALNPTVNESAPKVIVHEHPDMLGVWRLELEKKMGECEEMYHFKTNNQMSVVSAKEWTYGTYKILDLANKKLPVMVLHTIYDDNNRDCSGIKKDQSGERFAAYLKHQHKNAFELCVDSEGKNCVMKFKKVLP